jgi:hypothetical protein
LGSTNLSIKASGQSIQTHKRLKTAKMAWVFIKNGPKDRKKGVLGRFSIKFENLSSKPAQ